MSNSNSCNSLNYNKINDYLLREHNYSIPCIEKISPEKDNAVDVKPVIYSAEGNMCRACLTQNLEMQSLFSLKQDSVASLIDMFMSCTSLDISEHDVYPKQICSNCIEELARAFEFRAKCHNSIIELNRIIANSSFKNVVNVEVDVSIVKTEPEMIINDSIEQWNNNPGPHKRFRFILPKSKQMEQSMKRQQFVAIKKITPKKNKSNGSSRVNNKPYTCTICEKKFDRLQRLVDHEEKHIIVKKCRKCHIDFNTIESYKEHMKTHNMCLCPDCGQVKSRSGFQAHLLSHSNEHPHECKECGKRYKTICSLNVHMRNHSGEKPYVCEHCGEKFITWNSKSSHIITHHTEARPHVCKICNKAFKRQGKLTVHMRQHTGEKPYQCPHCPMAFGASSTRKMHILTHTGEKNIVCLLCDKRFTKRYNLKQHMVTHTGERQFSCEICSRRFSQAHVLRNHMRKHGENYESKKIEKEND